MDRRQKWKEENYDRVLDYQLRWNRDRRVQAIEKLGGHCARCGFSDVRALQIDHVHGLTGKLREHRSETWRRVLADSHPGEYQVLCANCNWIKRAENGEHGGRKTRRPRKENVS